MSNASINSHCTQLPCMPHTCTGRKEGHFLFNDTLNTFYVCLCGFRHMIKDDSDSKKGHPLHLFMGNYF